MNQNNAELVSEKMIKDFDKEFAALQLQWNDALGKNFMSENKIAAFEDKIIELTNNMHAISVTPAVSRQSKDWGLCHEKQADCEEGFTF